MPLYLIKQVIMTYGRVEKYLHAFLTSALKGESWVLSLGHFTLKETAAGTQRAGYWWVSGPVWTPWKRGKNSLP
jgi:hypothetical protein